MTDPTDLIARADAAMDGVTTGWWSQVCESIDPEWRIVTANGAAIVANVNGADEANARFIAASRQLVPALRDALAAAVTRAEAAECHAEALEAERDRLRLALAGMMQHSCVADAGADMKDAEDHAAERMARAALTGEPQR